MLSKLGTLVLKDKRLEKRKEEESLEEKLKRKLWDK